ncbi:MAG: hypothetical protein ACKVXR_00080 [Planctomycetota bacterium]
MGCSHARSVAFLFLGSLVGVARGQGPCPSWAPGFEHVDYGVRLVNSITGEYESGIAGAIAFFDEGSGPRLFVGGLFSAAGETTTSYVARWGGSDWSAVGAFPGINVVALVVHDDGSGPALFAVGEWVGNTTVARWNGMTWTDTGAGAFPGTIRAMTEFDDGSGSKLYALYEGDPSRVYVWDGVTWSQFGADFPDPLYAMAGHDDGTGPALYVGGLVTPSFPAQGVFARWDGNAWSPVGSGAQPDHAVLGMATYDDGSGPALFAGGGFTSIGGVPAMRIAKWDGSSWSALGTGVAGYVGVLATIDAGAGPRLHVAGGPISAGGLPPAGVVAWDGSTWTSLGSAQEGQFEGGIGVLVADPTGTGLYAAGDFQYVDGVEMNSLAHWDGSSWSPVGPPAGDGMNHTVHALASVNLGSGTTLYAGGSFWTASGSYAQDLARWDGSSWQGITSYTDSDGPTVSALAVWDDGGGRDLYLAAGPEVRRFDGSTLSANLAPFGSGALLLALSTFDAGSGTRLYAAGSMHPQSPHHNIASFNGASWFALGGGTNGAIHALAEFDDGGGRRLYAGGAFTQPGNHLASWYGSTWSTLPSTPDGPVKALCVFNDGTGPALYVGGDFTLVGGLPANNIAKWDGTSWTALGSGVDGTVLAMTVLHDGSGPTLFVGGEFSTAGGFGASFIAQWDGGAWSPLGNGTNGPVLTLAGHGPDLFIGGEFTSVDGIPSDHVAKWRLCASPGTRICFGDGSLATPCPCNNFGGTSRGCENSSSTGGATLDSTGTTVPDTMVLFAEGERSTALTIFLQGTENHTGGFVYGDGLRCASGTLKRLYTKTASGGAVSAPTMGEPSITARSAALGNPIAPGARRYYQTYYRDGNAAFCPTPAGSSFNSSNAVKILW